MVLVTRLTLLTIFLTRLIFDSKTRFQDVFLEHMAEEVSPSFEDSIMPKIVAAFLLL